MIQRYNIKTFINNGEACADYCRVPDGEVVFYADHAAALAAKDAEIARLTAKLAAFAPFADEEGEPRKVLGTLPVLASGEFAGDGAAVFPENAMKWRHECLATPFPVTVWGDLSRKAQDCYSTEAAALAARKDVK